MTRNMNLDEASSRKRIKTCDNSTGVVPWSDLNHDVLLLVMMRLGFVDFLGFSGVCKSWRSLALSNKKKFIVSRAPMSISISTDANEKEYCYLKDFEGRKFKTVFPHSSGRTCIGLTCGYLILFGEKQKDFWLVNPITRHELHFPDIPFDVSYNHESFRAILVFSSSISGWVFVVLKTFIEIWFSIAGERKWTHVSIDGIIHDIHAFKGKIYALHPFNHLSEVTLYPAPKLTLLDFKNFPKPFFDHAVLLTFRENLYVIDVLSKQPYKIHEIDFSKMECVSCEKRVAEFALFFSTYKHASPVIGAQLWSDVCSQYRRYDVPDESEKGRFVNADMWYFFHECLNVNLLHEVMTC